MTDASTPRPNTTRKRARRVALVIAGAATMGLAGCEDERLDAQAFPDVDSCIEAAATADGWFNETDCREQFAAAEVEHLETAPRYADLATCEAEHGVGNCGGDPVAQPSSGGGSIFMPLFMGYMLGSMLGRGGGLMSKPLMRTPDGGFTTPKGETRLSSNRAGGKVAPGVFQRAPTTAGRPPMTRSDVARRGGFGASRTQGRGVGGRFGG